MKSHHLAPFLLFGPPFYDIAPFGANFIACSAFFLSLEFCTISALWLSSYSSFLFKENSWYSRNKSRLDQFFHSTLNDLSLTLQSDLPSFKGAFHSFVSKKRTRFFQNIRILTDFYWIFFRKRNFAIGVPDFVRLKCPLASVGQFSEVFILSDLFSLI